ncbi:MAG: hypothetical protein GY877_13395 [Hyphomicrobium sp.]|nr:hypothetical protein [Hyphomicrobium sp.]
MTLLALWVPAARRQARLRCWSAAFAAAFALPSGRLVSTHPVKTALRDD